MKNNKKMKGGEKTIRILIIDDSDLQLKMLQKVMLQATQSLTTIDLKFEILEANNCDKFVSQVINNNNIDIIFTDIDLEKKTIEEHGNKECKLNNKGYVAAHEVRKHSFLGPIIAITSNDTILYDNWGITATTGKPKIETITKILKYFIENKENNHDINSSLQEFIYDDPKITPIKPTIKIDGPDYGNLSVLEEKAASVKAASVKAASVKAASVKAASVKAASVKAASTRRTRRYQGRSKSSYTNKKLHQSLKRRAQSAPQQRWRSHSKSNKILTSKSQKIQKIAT